MPSAVLIHLPRGPALAHEAQDSTTFSQLRELKLPFPIVQLNYRLGPSHPYPTPIHDVLRGYDWVKEHLLPKRIIARLGRSERVGKVAVCGELLGGGLAAMLALTECRAGQPGIVAAALSNPIVDWVDLEDDGITVGKTGRTNTAPSAAAALTTQLHGLRGKVFRKPEHYFDPFASPMLFLRSPGGAIPPAPPEIPVDDMGHLTQLDREDFRHVSEQSPEDMTPQKRTAKRYPSPLLGLRLPAFHLQAGQSSPLLCSQTEEFTQRLRQAHVRQAGEADFGRKVLEEDELDEMDGGERREVVQRELEARKRAQLSVSRDSGLWDDSVAGRARLAEMARWVGEALR